MHYTNWAAHTREMGAAGIVVGMTTVPAQLSAIASLPLIVARVGDFTSTEFGNYQIAPKPLGERLWLVAAKGRIRCNWVPVKIRFGKLRCNATQMTGGLCENGIDTLADKTVGQKGSAMVTGSGNEAVGGKTSAVAGASGRVSLRAGERRGNPFDRQRARTRRLRGAQAQIRNWRAALRDP